MGKPLFGGVFCCEDGERGESGGGRDDERDFLFWDVEGDGGDD